MTVRLNPLFRACYFLVALGVCLSWLLYVVDPSRAILMRVMPLSTVPLPHRMVFVGLLTSPIVASVQHVYARRGLVAAVRATFSLTFLWVCWGASMFCLFVPVSLTSVGLGGFWETAHGEDVITVIASCVAVGLPVGVSGLVCAPLVRTDSPDAPHTPPPGWQPQPSQQPQQPPAWPPQGDGGSGWSDERPKHA